MGHAIVRFLPCFRLSHCDKNLLVLSFVATVVSGCATTPLVPLTIEQEKFREKELRLMFAKLIAQSNGFGANNMFIGKRFYSDAFVSIPPKGDAVSIVICAKVKIRNDVVGERQLDLSASTTEGINSTQLSMSNYPDLFGARCKTPFVPFPELELLSSR